MRRLSRRRTARQEAGEFLIDGPTLLAEALGSSVRVQRVFVETSAREHPVLSRVSGDVRVLEVADGALARVLDLVNPNGMVAVAALPPLELSALLARSGAGTGPLLVLIDVADPGNAGTMVRVAEATGCGGVVSAGTTTDLFAPKVVRAAAGSLFRLPLARVADPSEVLGELRAAGRRLFATVVSGGRPPEDVDLREAVVVVGNEAHGLPAELVEVCDGRITVPMEGEVESLNAAMAATAVLFEAARQRRLTQ